MLEWLLLPIDETRPHLINGLTSWHARFMVLAWGIFVPLAILIARYFKITPNQNWPHELDNKFWWYSHLSLHISAIVLSVIALILILIHHGGGQDFHRTTGWIVIALMIVQALSGAMRGSKGGPTEKRKHGDHYDMTLHRYLFEYIHKTFGYLALLLAVSTIISGLWQVNAPRWMWIIIITWWLALLIATICLQKQKRCVETYQAIWGPYEKHPGNHMPIVGIGTNRHPIISKTNNEANKNVLDKKNLKHSDKSE